MLFKKLNLKIIKKVGFNEYSFNHLLNYINVKKRVPAKGLKNILVSIQKCLSKKT